jgi:hypothetical protein
MCAVSDFQISNLCGLVLTPMTGYPQTYPLSATRRDDIVTPTSLLIALRND